MEDNLYHKALSLYNKGEYDEVLKALLHTETSLSDKEKVLLRESRKQVTEQYLFLVKEFIQQKEYEKAKKLQEEYVSKYNFDDRIADIAIATNTTSKQNQISNGEILNEPQSIISETVQSNKNEHSTSQYKKWLFGGSILVVSIISLVIFGFNIPLHKHILNMVYSSQQEDIEIVQETKSDATLDIISNKAKEQTPQTGLTLSGKIDNKYKVVMNLTNDDGEITGNYYYTKSGSNNTLRLEGTLLNGKMQLSEYNYKNENTGYFDGILEGGVFYGTFTNYKGTKMLFRLYYETKATSSNISFNSYQNSRFNYSIAYPSFLNKKQESDNGNGCKFYMNDNTYLSVYGRYNSLNETLEDKYNEYKVKSPVYSILKNNWFVVSDYTEDGDIFYLKTVLKDNIFMTAILVYPKDEKDYYSPIIPKMFTKFPN